MHRVNLRKRWRGYLIDVAAGTFIGLLVQFILLAVYVVFDLDFSIWAKFLFGFAAGTMTTNGYYIYRHRGMQKVPDPQESGTSLEHAGR